jgi:type IV pilus assembly protein PilW
MRSRFTIRGQHGLTLIELMVAMVISILVVLVAASFYLSSSRTRATQDSAAQLQDTARYVTEIVTKNIQQAGYQDYILPELPPGAAPRPLREMQVVGGPQVLGIVGFNNSATGAGTDHGQHDRTTDRVNNSDTLVVRFQGMSSTRKLVDGAVTTVSAQADGSIIDCRGLAQPAPLTIDDRIFSIFEVRLNNGEPELVCKYFDRTTATFVSETIARGVETFQLMYGLDLDGDSFPEQWFTAQQVDLVLGRWDKVRSIRVGMVIRSLDRVTAATAAGTFKPLGDNFTLADADDPGATFTSTDDGRLRKVVTFTVNLRNAL